MASAVLVEDPIPIMVGLVGESLVPGKHIHVQQITSAQLRVDEVAAVRFEARTDNGGGCGLYDSIRRFTFIPDQLGGFDGDQRRVGREGITDWN